MSSSSNNNPSPPAGPSPNPNANQTIVYRLFTRFGARPVDIPIALIVFNGLLWPEWIACFAFCVRNRPVRHLMQTQPSLHRMHLRLQQKKVYSGLEKYISKSSAKISQYKWFIRMAKRVGAKKPENVPFALIETIIVYNILLVPVFAPINLLSALSFVQFYRSYINSAGNNNSNRNSNGSPPPNANTKAKQNTSTSTNTNTSNTNKHKNTRSDDSDASDGLCKSLKFGEPSILEWVFNINARETFGYSTTKDFCNQVCLSTLCLCVFNENLKQHLYTRVTRQPYPYHRRTQHHYW